MQHPMHHQGQHHSSQMMQMMSQPQMQMHQMQQQQQSLHQQQLMQGMPKKAKPQGPPMNRGGPPPGQGKYAHGTQPMGVPLIIASESPGPLVAPVTGSHAQQAHAQMMQGHQVMDSSHEENSRRMSDMNPTAMPVTGHKRKGPHDDVVLATETTLAPRSDDRHSMANSSNYVHDRVVSKLLHDASGKGQRERTGHCQNCGLATYSFGPGRIPADGCRCPAGPLPIAGKQSVKPRMMKQNMMHNSMNDQRMVNMGHPGPITVNARAVQGQGGMGPIPIIVPVGQSVSGQQGMMQPMNVYQQQPMLNQYGYADDNSLKKKRKKGAPAEASGICEQCGKPKFSKRKGRLPGEACRCHVGVRTRPRSAREKSGRCNKCGQLSYVFGPGRLPTDACRCNMGRKSRKEKLPDAREEKGQCPICKNMIYVGGRGRWPRDACHCGQYQPMKREKIGLCTQCNKMLYTHGVGRLPVDSCKCAHSGKGLGPAAALLFHCDACKKNRYEIYREAPDERCMCELSRETVQEKAAQYHAKLEAANPRRTSSQKKSLMAKQQADRVAAAAAAATAANMAHVHGGAPQQVGQAQMQAQMMMKPMPYSQQKRMGNPVTVAQPAQQMHPQQHHQMMLQQPQQTQPIPPPDPTDDSGVIRARVLAKDKEKPQSSQKNPTVVAGTPGMPMQSMQHVRSTHQQQPMAVAPAAVPTTAAPVRTTPQVVTAVESVAPDRQR